MRPWTRSLIIIGVVLAVLGIFLFWLDSRADSAPQDRATKIALQLKKERTAAKREIADLKRQLRIRYQPQAEQSIRFGAKLTGGSYRQGLALVRCETGNTFSPYARNPTSLGASDVHTTGLWQWLFDEEPRSADSGDRLISRASSWHNLLGGFYSEFSPLDPTIQSIASFQLAARSGGWYNAWKDICGTIADRS